MIVDCHAHVFQNWKDACGHSSIDVHLKYLQKIVTRPAAKAFRARDGKEIVPSMLFSATDNTWEGLANVSFRVGRYGQLQFTYEAEDYVIQYMPVGMQEIEAPPEFMIAQMTYSGVDRCILQTGGGYGAMNDFNAFAQSQYPNKFSALFQIDEAVADSEESLAEIDRAHGRLGLKGVYYAQDFSRHGYQRNLDHSDFARFWDKVSELKLPVFLELSATPDYDKASYIANLMAFDRLLQRLPDSRFLLVMGPPVAHFAESGRWNFPPEVLKAYKRDNLQLEIMFPISYGGRWEYPYPEAQELVCGMRDIFGAAKLVWGSDMPNVERYCTYRQSLDYIRMHCPFLTPSEKDLILGSNAADLVGIAAET